MSIFALLSFVSGCVFPLSILKDNLISLPVAAYQTGNFPMISDSYYYIIKFFREKLRNLDPVTKLLIASVLIYELSSTS